VVFPLAELLRELPGYQDLVCIRYMIQIAPDASLFGKAVSNRAADVGSWLTLDVSVDDFSKAEDCLKCQAVDAHRTKPG
jgi:hypothetical protein